MKFAAIVLLCLFVSTLGLGLNKKKLTSATTKQIDALKKNKSWGKVALDMAELHMLAKGPLDDLLTALQNLVSDLQEQQADATSDFDDRTTQHHGEL
jgi:hypothetical protein